MEGSGSGAPMRAEDPTNIVWGVPLPSGLARKSTGVQERIRDVANARAKAWDNFEEEITKANTATDVGDPWVLTDRMNSNVVEIGSILLTPTLKGWEDEHILQATCMSTYFAQYAPGFVGQLPEAPVYGRKDVDCSDEEVTLVPVDGESESRNAESVPKSAHQRKERCRQRILESWLLRSFYSQHPDVLESWKRRISPECTTDHRRGNVTRSESTRRCMGPILYSSRKSCIFIPINWENIHWVGVAVHNLQDLRRSGGKGSTIVIMDSLDSGVTEATKNAGKESPAAGGKEPASSKVGNEPEFHKELIGYVRLTLYSLFGGEHAVCSACARKFEDNVRHVSNFDGVPAVSPVVPQQTDFAQCGAMTLLAIQSYVRWSVFRRHCVAGKRCTKSPTLTFYSHSDALSLRNYLLGERNVVTTSRETPRSA